MVSFPKDWQSDFSSPDTGQTFWLDDRTPDGLVQKYIYNSISSSVDCHSNGDRKAATLTWLKGSVPMFPGTYVPRYRCSPNLCSPVPMFPGTDVPRFLYFNSGH